jgi:hypothetical protein
MKHASVHIPVLIAAALMLFSAVHPAAAADIQFIVPTQYSTIQAALDEAYRLQSQPSNTNSYSVLVEPGEYPGGILLRSNIPLRGRETARTILNGSGSDAVLIANSVNDTSGIITGVSVRNFTFKTATIGVQVTGNVSLTIANNVFVLGLGGTGVQSQNATSVRVINNTFYQNGIGVLRDTVTTEIRNNIFLDNAANINGVSNPVNIAYNGFYPGPLPGDILGTSYLPNTAFPDTDPIFVNANIQQGDFHLKSTSPCIDQGDPSILDSTFDASRSDIGVYGGPDTDTIPTMIAGLASSATSTNSVALSWTANEDYRVTGYRISYGYASGSYDGTDATEGPSPIDAGNVTSFAMTSLATSTIALASPLMYTPAPRSGALDLSWSAVPGATSYKVHYGIASTNENTVDVGNVTDTTLGGLTNGQAYMIAVSAVAQPTYYLAVTAFTTQNVSQLPVVGKAYESAYVESVVQVGPVSESALSNEVPGLPEALTAYPDLPNSGCFIATAAYGSADALPVLALREFRDRWLLTNGPGRAFVRWYYRSSPPLARFLNNHPAGKPLTRAVLAPAVLAALAFRSPPAAQTLLVIAMFALIVIARRRKAS